MLGIDLTSPLKTLEDGINAVTNTLSGAGKAALGAVDFVGDGVTRGIAAGTSLLGFDGRVDVVAGKLRDLSPFITATAAKTAGSTLPPEFDGFIKDIKGFSSEMTRIREALANTTDPAERAALSAELQFNLNMMSQTISMMSNILKTLNDQAQSIISNLR